jgi:hypothetical protein
MFRSGPVQVHQFRSHTPALIKILTDEAQRFGLRNVGVEKYERNFAGAKQFKYG